MIRTSRWLLRRVGQVMPEGLPREHRRGQQKRCPVPGGASQPQAALPGLHDGTSPSPEQNKEVVASAWPWIPVYSTFIGASEHVRYTSQGLQVIINAHPGFAFLLEKSSESLKWKLAEEILSHNKKISCFISPLSSILADRQRIFLAVTTITTFIEEKYVEQEDLHSLCEK